MQARISASFIFSAADKSRQRQLLGGRNLRANRCGLKQEILNFRPLKDEEGREKRVIPFNSLQGMRD